MGNHLTLYQLVITEIKSIISCGQEAAYSTSSKARSLVKIVLKEIYVISLNFISDFPMSRL